MTDVAVIGHGPSLAGSRKGEHIDACSAVVRMHDSDWQNPADYGARFDYGVLPGPWLGLAVRMIKAQPKHWWVFRYDHRFQTRFRGSAVVVPKNSTLFILDRWARIVADCGMTRPDGGPILMTRGFAAIIMAIVALKPRRVLAFGCDWIMSGSEATPQYPQSYLDYATYHSMLSSDPRHNSKAERRALDIASKETGVEIVSC